LRLAAGLALAVLLDTVIQLAWKQAAGGALGGPGLVRPLGAVLTSGWFAVAMVAFAAQLWNWLRVLAQADLSFAQPITALSYVSVLGCSVLLLHEQVSLRQGLGVGSILVGVWFISRTPPVSAGRAASSGPS